jgi:hypothetical protein
MKGKVMSLFKFKIRSPLGEVMSVKQEMPVDTIEEATSVMEQSIDRGNVEYLLMHAQLTGIKAIIPGRLLSVELLSENEQPMPDGMRAFLEGMVAMRGAK